MGLSQNEGYHFGGPTNKDSSILGSMLRCPYIGKVPNPGEIVGKCVATWFGSERAFNDTVRSSVALALEQQLGNDARLVLSNTVVPLP